MEVCHDEKKHWKTISSIFERTNGIMQKSLECLKDRKNKKFEETTAAENDITKVLDVLTCLVMKHSKFMPLMKNLDQILYLSTY